MACISYQRCSPEAVRALSQAEASSTLPPPARFPSWPLSSLPSPVQLLQL